MKTSSLIFWLFILSGYAASACMAFTLPNEKCHERADF
jgi:hypothetical protein